MIERPLDQFQNRLTRLWRQFRRRMRSRSVLTLQLVGFLLVALPLVIGLVVSSQQISRVTRDSEQLLEHAISASQAARMVSDRVLAFERSARQFRVLQDEAARQSLERRYQATLDGLATFENAVAQRDVSESVQEITAHHQALLQRTLQVETDVEWPTALAEGFEHVKNLAQQLLAETENAAQRDLERLERRGAAARTSSLVGLALTIPVAVLIAIILARRINRPIRHLDRAMRGLARPDSKPIEQIASPRDLRALSVRLEWVRRRLARIERDRQRLVGQVSHELKTPLSAIREGTSLLEDQSFGQLGEQQHEVIDIIQANVSRLQEQIENLLRFNRLQSSPDMDFQARVELKTLVDQVIDNHRLSLEAQHMQLERWMEKDVRVDCDPSMLGTAVDNLVSNALKFSPPGGTIGIGVRAGEGVAVISVADQGRGIRPADRPRLFEPFYRGDDPGTRARPGSGLGLAICRDLVRAHGGEVRLAEQRGWSTVFEIELPLSNQGITAS